MMELALALVALGGGALAGWKLHRGGGTIGQRLGATVGLVLLVFVIGLVLGIAVQPQSERLDVQVFGAFQGVLRGATWAMHGAMIWLGGMLAGALLSALRREREGT